LKQEKYKDLKTAENITKKDILKFVDTYNLDNKTKEQLMKAQPNMKYLEYDKSQGDILYSQKTPIDYIKNQNIITDMARVGYETLASPELTKRIPVNKNAQFKPTITSIAGMPYYNIQNKILYETGKLFDMGVIRNSDIRNQIKSSEKVEKYKNDLLQGKNSVLSNIMDFPEYNEAFMQMYPETSDKSVIDAFRGAPALAYDVAKNPLGTMKDTYKGFQTVATQSAFKTWDDVVESHNQNPGAFWGNSLGSTIIASSALTSMGKYGNYVDKFDLVEVPFEAAAAKMYAIGKKAKTKLKPNERELYDEISYDNTLKIENGKVTTNYKGIIEKAKFKLFDKYLVSKDKSILQDIKTLNENTNLDELEKKHLDVTEYIKNEKLKLENKAKNYNDEIINKITKYKKEVENKKEKVEQYIKNNKISLKEILEGKIHTKFFRNEFENTPFYI
jgi:hypothetical protein